MRHGTGHLNLLVLAAALVLTAWAQPGAACDCSGPKEPFEELLAAAQVFEAELMYELPKALNSSNCAWQVKMLRAWKGTSTKKDEPVVNNCWCQKPGLRAGKTYIFYTHAGAKGSRNIFRCSRVVPSDQAADDLAELGEPTEVRAPGQPLRPTGKKKAPARATPEPLRRWRPFRLATCSAAPVGVPSPWRPSWIWALIVASATVMARRRAARWRARWLLLLLLGTLLGCQSVFTAPCGNDSHCGPSGGCVDGWCYETAEYCKKRYYCIEEGLCTLRDRECILGSKDDCKNSTRCVLSGKCTPRGGLCAVTSDADCQRSQSCSSHGLCTHKGGKCALASSDDCRRASISCKRDGECALRNGFCRATSDTDCEGSIRCTKYGACTARHGHCIRSCDKSVACTRSGLCHTDGELCVADADSCKRSKDCLQWGRCTPSKNKRTCQVGSDEDCRNSRLCSEQGQCFAAAGVGCEARSVDDCSRSSGCPDRGGCGLVDKRCGPRSKADCDESTACKKFRICTFRGHRCLPR